jgi:hypothetical protein
MSENKFLIVAPVTDLLIGQMATAWIASVALERFDQIASRGVPDFHLADASGLSAPAAWGPSLGAHVVDSADVGGDFRMTPRFPGEINSICPSQETAGLCGAP